VSIAFLITSLIIVATPGTGALISLSAGLSRGPRASVVAAFGCTLGIVPHLIAAITGTAALLRASGVAFDLLRVLGVVYLLVMAVATWRDKRRRASSARPFSPTPSTPSSRSSSSLSCRSSCHPTPTTNWLACCCSAGSSWR
jgi:threonine/homoserine/homoserine lactone efflux protein